jgi:hypothetical protein
MRRVLASIALTSPPPASRLAERRYPRWTAFATESLSALGANFLTDDNDPDFRALFNDFLSTSFTQMMTGIYYSHNSGKINTNCRDVLTRLATPGRYFKTKFTADEDALLMQLVSQFGSDDWNQVSRFMGTRNGRQCRERYKNYLNPTLNQSPWTAEEDQILLSQFQQYGAKWNTIAKSFTNRSDLSLRNRYNQLNRQMNRQEPVAAPATPLCGEKSADVEMELPEAAGGIVPVTPAPEPWNTSGGFDDEVGGFGDLFDIWNWSY